MLFRAPSTLEYYYYYYYSLAAGNDLVRHTPLAVSLLDTYTAFYDRIVAKTERKNKNKY